MIPLKLELRNFMAYREADPLDRAIDVQISRLRHRLGDEAFEEDAEVVADRAVLGDQGPLGAPLLGVAGLTLVGHGRSSAKAVRNALAMAHRFADSQFVPTLAQEIAEAAKGPR